MVYEVAKALKYMHSKGIMHRNICPRSIRINRDTWEVKVIDFMNATTFEGNNHMPRGHGQYMAPEMLQLKPLSGGGSGGKYDEKVDVWALGILFIKMAYNDEPNRNSHYNDIERNISRHDRSQAPKRKKNKENECCLGLWDKKDPIAVNLLKIGCGLICCPCVLLFLICKLLVALPDLIEKCCSKIADCCDCCCEAGAKCCTFVMKKIDACCTAVGKRLSYVGVLLFKCLAQIFKGIAWVCAQVGKCLTFLGV